jgi:uncharacterized protein
MVTIREELSLELRDAMKAGDSRRRDVIRQIETEIAMSKSDPGFSGEIDDALYQKVIGSYVKKMEKSRDEYAGYGERGAAMAEKLAFEVEYLSRWLPRKLDEAATRSLVVEAIEELGVDRDEKTSGRVIGHLMRTRGGDLDGGLVDRIVREEITKA